jgi:hypothetical protein
MKKFTVHNIGGFSPIGTRRTSIAALVRISSLLFGIKDVVRGYDQIHQRIILLP